MNLVQRPQRLAARRHRESSLTRLLSLFLIGLALLAAGFALAVLGPMNGVAAPVPTTAPNEARSASLTYRQPAAGGSLLSLDQARHSALSFSERSDLELEGGLERGAFGTGAFEIYYLETVDRDGAGLHSFKVDARTGEVLEMARLGNVAAPSAAGGIKLLDAEALAERYAADRFLGFRSLTLVDRTVSPGVSGELYVYKWAMLAPESGAELPTSVVVSLEAASGEVTWYLAQRDTTDVDVQPAVDREVAVATAAELVERAGRWDARTPSSIRLQVLRGADNRQQLVWAVTFPSRPEAEAPGRPNLRVLVDAQTGEPAANLN